MTKESPYRLTVQDVIDSMTEEQKTVMYAVVGQALKYAEQDVISTKKLYNILNEEKENKTDRKSVV